MGERDGQDQGLHVDDMDADVTAAFAELAKGGGNETPSPAAPTPAPAANDAEKGAGDPPADPSQRPRDEGGRFAKADQAKPAAPADAAKPDAAKPAGADGTTKPEDQQQPVTADQPPPSWSPKAKLQWQTLPPEIKGEIAKREGEMAQGLAALRDYKDLKPWADLARQHGTTIDGALRHYVTLDDHLRRDLHGGFGALAESYGLTQAEIGRLFSGLAQKYGAAPAPTNGARPAPQGDEALMEILQPFLTPITKQLNDFGARLSGRDEADRNASHRSLGVAVSKFAADPANTFFSDVEEQMATLFNTGIVPLTGNHAADLKAAYDLAVRMNPAVSEALIEKRLADSQAEQRRKDQEAAEAARAASRSLGGSRMPGAITHTQGDNRGQVDDVEADVMAAYRQHLSA